MRQRGTRGQGSSASNPPASDEPVVDRNDPEVQAIEQRRHETYLRRRDESLEDVVHAAARYTEEQQRSGPGHAGRMRSRQNALEDAIKSAWDAMQPPEPINALDVELARRSKTIARGEKPRQREE